MAGELGDVPLLHEPFHFISLLCFHFPLQIETRESLRVEILVSRCDRPWSCVAADSGVPVLAFGLFLSSPNAVVVSIGRLSVGRKAERSLHVELSSFKFLDLVFSHLRSS